MIKIEKTEVLGLEPAIRGMRNPLNSWDKQDSFFDGEEFIIGRNDFSLMEKLAKAGSSHAKYRRMIVVYADVTAPLYWWKEYDTYKVGTVANSCSTMHTIHKKEFTLDDFSHEYFNESIIHFLVNTLNYFRYQFNETKDKKYWYQMIQLLPTSYNQKRTVMLNYEVLANMYHDRKNHKLDEWVEFCEWVKGLPFSEIIIGEQV
jgi:hypothetical protein